MNNTGKNISKKKIQNNHSNTIRIYNNKRSKKVSPDNSLNISKNFGKIIRRVKTKELKPKQESHNNINNSGNEISLYRRNKKNNNNIDSINLNILNTDMRTKKPNKQYYNKKHEKVYNTFNLDI